MNTTLASRRPAAGAELVNILLGIWVAVSPFILGFTRTAAMWNNLSVGIALLIVTLICIWGDEALKAWAFSWVPGFSSRRSS